MGVNVKLVVLILALSASALGDDTLVSTESTLSDNVPVIPDDVTATVETKDTKDEAVELLENADTLEVKSGKYQRIDGDDSLTNDTPVELQPIDFGSSDVQNERQVYGPPSTTSVTNTEYGKW